MTSESFLEVQVLLTLFFTSDLLGSCFRAVGCTHIFKLHSQFSDKMPKYTCRHLCLHTRIADSLQLFILFYKYIFDHCFGWTLNVKIVALL